MQVHFQSVPPATTLQTLLPSGRPVLNSKPFTMPRPAFGPGSIGYTVKKTPSPVDVDDSDIPDAGTTGRVREQDGERHGDGGEKEDEDGTRGIAVWGKDQGGSGADYF
jgi:hypothetical protein